MKLIVLLDGICQCQIYKYTTDPFVIYHQSCVMYGCVRAILDTIDRKITTSILMKFAVMPCMANPNVFISIKV